MDTTTSHSRNFELQHSHSQSPLDALVRTASSQASKLESQVPQEQWSVREDLDGSEQQREMMGQQRWTIQTDNPPISPLLHGQFARDSFATNSSQDNNSFMTGPVHPPNYDDDESIYSEAPSHTVDFLQSANMLPHSSLGNITCARQNTEPTWGSVPAVIVTSADTDVRSLHAYTSRTASMAVATPKVFSSGSDPPIIPPSDDEKRRVLERNMYRTSGHQSDGVMSQRPSSNSHPLLNYSLRGEAGEGRALSPDTYGQRPFITSVQSPVSVTVPTALSVSPLNSQIPDSLLAGPKRSKDHSYYPAPKSKRDLSPAIPSSSRQYLHSDHQISVAINGSKSQQSQTPHEYLQLGIQCHEADKLQDSATYFEKSAKENGGCGVGMLMWGLALRHGWGCPKDEKKGFMWLQRAAEYAVDDLNNVRVGMDSNLVQTELVLAIYEVGQCFFQGWGVPKDQKMAVSYYQVAARLGDPDAQNDLAFCLANGKGCKKDRKEAAKWYRAAVAQGQSDIGLAWIYKEKYQ